MKLTPAKLRYLLTIAALEKTGDGIRCIDIAVQLGVSQASACRMLSAFAGEGILSQEPDRTVRLTETGRRMAQGYEDRFGQLYPFFHETLELSPYDARECAMALCASLSQGSMTALCESLAMKAGLPGC